MIFVGYQESDVIKETTGGLFPTNTNKTGKGALEGNVYVHNDILALFIYVGEVRESYFDRDGTECFMKHLAKQRTNCY